nr:signal peptidase I [Cellulomonas sp. RIT-PI-Y]
MIRHGRRAARTGVAPTRRPRPARLRSAAGWVLTGALVAVLVWFGWPTTLGGCTTLTIVSGHSMEPTYYTGDLVVSRCGVPTEGDVVVYTPPGVEDGRVIHRVVGGDAAEGWAIRGDNNDFDDPWRPTQPDILGIAVLHVPGLGRIASILLDPWAWASLLVIAGGVLLWPGKESPAEPAEPADASGPAAPRVLEPAP